MRLCITFSQIGVQSVVHFVHTFFEHTTMGFCQQITTTLRPIFAVAEMDTYSRSTKKQCVMLFLVLFFTMASRRGSKFVLKVHTTNYVENRREQGNATVCTANQIARLFFRSTQKHAKQLLEDSPPFFLDHYQRPQPTGRGKKTAWFHGSRAVRFWTRAVDFQQKVNTNHGVVTTPRRQTVDCGACWLLFIDGQIHWRVIFDLHRSAYFPGPDAVENVLFFRLASWFWIRKNSATAISDLFVIKEARVRKTLPFHAS